MNLPDPRMTYFDSLAARWDGEEPSAEVMTQRMAQQAKLLALKAGQSLLEVGCGTGKTTAWLAQQVAPGRVTAIDFAPAMMEHAVAKGIDADFACMDVCSDRLGSAAYDVILCFHSFPHFRDQPAAMANLARALKPGGRFIVMHLAGSQHINHFHAKIEGAVNGDMLPANGAWGGMLNQCGLSLINLIDREDLFFLEAVAAR